MNKVLILFLSIMPLFTTYAKGKSDEPSHETKESRPSLDNPKRMEGFSLEEGRLTVEGDKRDIAFSLDSEITRKKLHDTESYTHMFFNRPDGPIDMMELMKGDDLIFWVGDGIRADMGPSGLKVFPDEGVDKIKVETDGKSWDVSLNKETPIVWNDREYIVFVSKIKKGTMQDQPEFTVDIVIMLR